MMLTDRDVAVATIWGEARGEATEGRLAIACVLQNRLASGRWGHTLTNVCRAPFQFSCWNNGADANHAAVMALAAQLLAGQQPNDPVLREAYWLLDGVLGGQAMQRVGHATHYYAASMPIAPAWTVGAQLVSRVGSHLFYEGVR